MSPPTILIVEGNAVTRKQVHAALTAEGYAALEAPDGRTALELIARNPPDLVLQDLHLADVDGPDLVGQLRALPGGAEVPIIACSGFLSSVESARTLSLGFTDFLGKPVEPRRLLEIVRRYAGSPSTEPWPPRDCTVPIGRFRTTAQGRILDANPELLALLGCSAGTSLLGARANEFYFDIEDRRRLLDIAEREGRASGFEVRLRRRDGIVIWGCMNLRVLSQDGSVVYEGSVEDVTARRMTEQCMSAEHGVTRALAESSSLAEATPRLLEAVCTSLEWQVGELWRVDPTAGVLRRFDAWHVPSEALREFASVSRDMTFASGADMPGRVWATGEPVWVPDVGREPTFPRAALAVMNGLHRGFAFPIWPDGESLGVLAFFSDEIREPDEGLLRTMASIATQIGQSEKRWRAQTELERQRESLLRPARRVDR